MQRGCNGGVREVMGAGSAVVNGSLMASECNALTGRALLRPQEPWSFRSRKTCGRSAPCAGLALDAGDGVTAMADNIPQWSASDAVDRLRVAIERQQAATERQTATTRWLNVVMTALTILMAVPAVVQFWRFAHSEVWPVVRLWRPW